MVISLHDFVRQMLVLGASVFVAGLFAVGIFFAVSLLLVPLAALREGTRRQETAAKQNEVED